MEVSLGSITVTVSWVHVPTRVGVDLGANKVIRLNVPFPCVWGLTIRSFVLEEIPKVGWFRTDGIGFVCWGVEQRVVPVDQLYGEGWVTGFLPLLVERGVLVVPMGFPWSLLRSV